MKSFRLIPFVIVCFLMTFYSSVSADDENPAGHFLNCFYADSTSTAPDCSVRCYRYDIDWDEPDYYKTGFTGQYGQSPYPPYYHKCRFVDTTYSNFGYHIEPAEYRAYIYYAKKEVGEQMMYSDWSDQMQYPRAAYFGNDILYLTRTTPPPFPPEQNKIIEP